MAIKINFYSRETGQIEQEAVYGGWFLKHFYHPAIGKLSYFYGWLQSIPFSKRKVKSFIKKFKIDTSEFLDPVDSFNTFNEFFTRKIKPRTLSEGIIAPCDGRFLAFQKALEKFSVKGVEHSLETLLQDEKLAEEYANAPMVIARLAPVDYHRFHFPLDCTPGKAKEIQGPLGTVNPHRQCDLTRNKRMITDLGDALFIEVGATFVGTIHQTYTPDRLQKKGSEKGFFSFGGSCIILLFKNDSIRLSKDLLHYSGLGIETKLQMGDTILDDASNRALHE